MVLSQLLDTASFRRLQLIEKLVADDDWRTLETLSNQLGCSRRTLIADIQMINSRSEDYFYIKTSKQRGVRLIAFDHFHLENVYRDLIKSSLNFQIIRKVIELDTVARDDLADWLYISPSSLNRSLKQINAFLADYELTIQSNPIKIVGCEKQVRYFYSIILCGMYSSDMESFQHPLKKAATHFLEQLEEENESPPYSFITRYRNIIWLVICADRISRGYLIQETYSLPQPIKPKIAEVLNKLLKQLLFEAPEKEIAFIMFIYSSNHLEFSKLDQADDPSLISDYEELISFIEKIKTETSYTIDNQSLLINNLMGYCFYQDFFKGPSNLLLNPKRRLFGPSLALFNEFIEITRKLAKQYPNSPWKQENRIEEFTITLIVYWRGLVDQVVSKKEKIDVLIISSIGNQQELFLCDMLQARYPTVVNCYAASETTHPKKEYQIVLTDHSIKWIKEEIGLSKKVIGINMIPTKRDWKKIEETIELFRVS